MEDGVLVREIPLGDGTCRGFHKNGALKFEYQIVNGESEGIFREWHDNGQLAVERTHVCGQVQGTIKTWNRKGGLDQELEYVTPNAIYGKSYERSGTIWHLYLWNGKPIPKKRWLKKLEAAGFSPAELAKRFPAPVGPSRAEGAKE